MALFDPIKLCGAFLYDDVDYIKQAAFNIKRSGFQIPIGRFLLDLYAEKNNALFKLFAFAYKHNKYDDMAHYWSIRKLFKRILKQPDAESESMIYRICEQFSIGSVIQILYMGRNRDAYFKVLRILHKKFDLSKHLNSCHAMYIVKDYYIRRENIFDYGFTPCHYDTAYCKCSLTRIKTVDDPRHDERDNNKEMSPGEQQYIKNLNKLVEMGLKFNTKVRFKCAGYPNLFKTTVINIMLHNGFDFSEYSYLLRGLVSDGYDCVLKFIENFDKSDMLLEFLTSTAKSIVEYERSEKTYLILQHIISIDDRVKDLQFKSSMMLGQSWYWGDSTEEEVDLLLKMLKLFNLSQTSLNNLLFICTRSSELHGIIPYLVSKGADIRHENDTVFKHHCICDSETCAFILKLYPDYINHLDKILKDYFNDVLEKMITKKNNGCATYTWTNYQYDGLPLVSQYIGNIDISKILYMNLDLFASRIDKTERTPGMTDKEYEETANIKYISGDINSLIKATYALNCPCQKNIFDIIPENYRGEFNNTWDKCYSEYSVTKAIRCD